MLLKEKANRGETKINKIMTDISKENFLTLFIIEIGKHR